MKKAIKVTPYQNFGKSQLSNTCGFLVGREYKLFLQDFGAFNALIDEFGERHIYSDTDTYRLVYPIIIDERSK